MGTIIRIIRTSTNIRNRFRALYWLSNRMRPVSDLCPDACFSVSGRMLFGSTIDKLGRLDFGYMGCSPPRASYELLCFSAFCWTVYRAHSIRLYRGFRYRKSMAPLVDTDLQGLEMGLLGAGDILRGLDRLAPVHSSRDLERPAFVRQSPPTSSIDR